MLIKKPVTIMITDYLIIDYMDNRKLTNCYYISFGYNICYVTIYEYVVLNNFYFESDLFSNNVINK